MRLRIAIILIILFVFGMVLSAKAPKSLPPKTQLTWLTNFEQAKEQAKLTNTPILINFTGSDWCIWCKKLSSEVFEQRAFQDYAKKNIVLLKIDFPRSISQTPKLKKDNKVLAEQYGITGYPSIVLVDFNGKEINRTGYQEGGAAKYVDHIKALLKVSR